MKIETILLITVVLVVGVLGGIIYSNAKKDSGAKPPISSVPTKNYQQEINALLQVVDKEPNNRQAWVQLGHNYFDSGNPMQAIDAYDKALELDANDPNVLTDQGVMYRRVGWFDKAIANFVQASRLDPSHVNSLYNMGIVYSQDLDDKIKAEEAWNRYLDLVPTGPAADKVRTMIDHMKNGHG